MKNRKQSKAAAFAGSLGLWLKGQASYGQKVPRKLIREAAVIMA